MKTNYEITENLLKIKFFIFLNHKDKNCILSRLKELKISSGLINSLKSETEGVTVGT